MKKLVVGVLYALCALTAVHSGDISAQSTTGTSTSASSSGGTTANLITSGTNHTWSGVTTGSIPTGCATAGPCPGGPTPLYDPATNSINFSYNAQAVVAQSIAINNALSSVGAGVKIGGYNYSYDVRNMNGDNRQGGVDTLNVYQTLMGTNGTALLSSQQTYNTKFEWQTISGQQNTGTPIEQASASYLQFKMVGGDNGYWGGYFGPQVRNVNMSLNYVATPVIQHTMGDDGWVNIPLQFGFPFYGKVFTNSFMFDNGVVGFFDPVAGGCNPANGWCGGQQWNSQPFSNNMSNQFSYMIAPLWADMAPNNNTKYLTQGDATFQKYTWENIGQYYDQSKLQTFDLTIKPSGFIGVNYGNVNLNMTNISVGTIGNPALGEYNQIAYHPAGTVVTGLPNWTLNNTPDACTANPLSNPSCPGYANAMCSANPLYAATCPGYQQAYFTQQCSSNPLYNQQCPGYAMAYLDLQCSANPLYSTTCQGYQQAQTECSANPLSHSYCPAYQTATTQCSVNPLYGSFCPGYTTASTECDSNPLSHSYCTNYQLATTECSANALYAPFCPGYQAAQTTCSTNPLSNNLCIGYTVASTECSADPLSHNYCPAYQTATTQCSASALYAPYCPGYQFAYACQQDGLYSNRCPNYSEAYAKKMLLEQQGLASTVATAGTVAAVAAADPANTVTTTTSTTTSDASSSATSSAISSNPVVASAVTTKATATTSETNPAAPVKLTAPPPAPAQQMAQAEPKKDNGPGPKEEKKDEGNKPNASNTNGPSGGDSKPSDSPKTARQELAEKRREAAAKEAVAKGKDLANEMGKASDMEAQKAVQNVVIQAMGFTPGFDTYNKAMIPDSRFYAPKVVYGGQVNVDNKNVSRRLMGGSDRLHQDMVDEQYNRGN